MRFLTALLFLTSASLADAPRVLKTVPANDTKDVASSTREIRITFDQPMDTQRGYSIVGGGPSFPRIIGHPKWVDEKNLVVRVRLEPSHNYWLSINSDTYANCVGKDGQPATPYPITFSTGKADPKSEINERKDANRDAISVLREAIDDDYSYRDLRGVDWNRQFQQFDAQLQSAASAGGFAKVVVKLLTPAGDLHISIHAGDQTFYAYAEKVPPANFNLRLLPKLVRQWTEHGNIVATGEFTNGPAYIFIKLWDPNHADHLQAAYDVLRHADVSRGLIIDVRPNGGGDEAMAQQFAGCFIEEPKVYGKDEIRAGGKFFGPFKRTLQPNADQPHYRGKVAVLMGPRCVSSNESFLLMMKAAGAKLVGSRSRGASGNPKPADLGNDVTVDLPSWRDMLPDGTCFEGVGIKPDIDVPTKPDDFVEADLVIDEALKYLKSV